VQSALRLLQQYKADEGSDLHALRLILLDWIVDYGLNAQVFGSEVKNGRNDQFDLKKSLSWGLLNFIK
jgi:hypothetical protein